MTGEGDAATDEGLEVARMSWNGNVGIGSFRYVLLTTTEEDDEAIKTFSGSCSDVSPFCFQPQDSHFCRRGISPAHP